MAVQNGAFTRDYSFSGESDRTVPEFFSDHVQDQLASEREGRPIYREEERVRIILPGNPHTMPVHRVTDEHRQRWPKQYADFKAGREISMDGTPIEQWPVLNRGMVLELKALHLHTIEQIAGMDDLACQRMKMAGQRLRILAQSYLDEAKAGAALAQATADNDRKDAQIGDLKAKVDELAGLVDRLHAELQGMKNAPSPIATAIPGMMDPLERAKTNPEPAGGSSLDHLAIPKRKGRPPLPRDEQGNIVR